MQNTQLAVTNEAGLHARPAAEFVKEAARYKSSVEVRNVTASSDWVDAKSILGVLTLGVERGHSIEIRTEGADEAEAISALSNLIQSAFAGRA